MATKLRTPVNTVYAEPIAWIKRHRAMEKSWGNILLCGTGNPTDARLFLTYQQTENGWPEDLTYARWKALVHKMSKEEREKKTEPKLEFVLNNNYKVKPGRYHFFDTKYPVRLDMIYENGDFECFGRNTEGRYVSQAIRRGDLYL